MRIFSVLIFVFALLTISFEYLDRRFLWLFKPATMLFTIALGYGPGTRRQGFYRNAILAGLAFSLVGDVFLINPQIYFVHGLAAFLVAHLCYIAAFARAGAARLNPAALGAFAVGFVLFWLISGGVPEELKIPVIFYTLAISAMLAAAVNFWLVEKTPAARFALAGAALFVASDAILAFNKFGYEFYAAKIFILSTYFLAQWLIARSVINLDS